MAGYVLRHPRRNFLARKRLQDLRFAQIRIFEHHRQDLRMTFGKQRARDARWSAPGQRNLVAQRKLRQPRQQLVFSVASELRRDRRRKRQLHQVHQVEIAEKA
jgi:hypothetical protein